MKIHIDILKLNWPSKKGWYATVI